MTEYMYAIGILMYLTLGATVVSKTACDIFTARRHDSAVYAVVVLCLYVCLVCLSQAGILLKRLNVGSCKQHDIGLIAQGI